MGPRLVSRGEMEAPSQTPIKESLQWGRGLLAAESRYESGALLSTDRLQWGRGLLAAESWPVFDQWLGDCRLQWGRGLLAAERTSAPASPH